MKGDFLMLYHDADDDVDLSEKGKIPVPQDVQQAIVTLLRWTGDDPEREGRGR